MPGKTKNQRNFYAGSFGGRGWISRAALLKTAHWAVFAPSSATSSQLFESTRPMSLALSQNKNLSVLAYVEVFLVGAGGFEPPKLKAADLQSVPIGHSGTRPYSLFVSFAGRLAYFIMKEGFCQLFFYLFLQMRFPCRETAEQRREKPCSHAGTAKSEKKPTGRN